LKPRFGSSSTFSRVSTIEPVPDGDRALGFDHRAQALDVAVQRGDFTEVLSIASLLLGREGGVGRDDAVIVHGLDQARALVSAPRSILAMPLIVMPIGRTRGAADPRGVDIAAGGERRAGEQRQTAMIGRLLREKDFISMSFSVMS
jgi:hypothetical protein